MKTEDVMVTDKGEELKGKIEQILKLNLKLLNPDYGHNGKVSENAAQLDYIAQKLPGVQRELDDRSAFIQNRSDRLNILLDVLLKYTILDFSQQIPLSKEGDELDAIALGLNTLGEELENYIHRLQENEKNLKEKAEDLLRSNQQLEQFVYIASHDLQEPLRTISNYVGLFQEDYKDKLDKTSARYLQFISGGSERMQMLITDLLEYARVGQLQDIAEVNMETVLMEALYDMAATIQKSHAHIISGPLPVIKGNAPELKSMLTNLFSNAIKFRKNEGPLNIQLSASESPVEWTFAVADNGIGIEPEFHQRIFYIFQRLNSRREYAGTGIGLAHCKKIAEAHKGKIWIESKPGEGSTFYFTISKNLDK